MTARMFVAMLTACGLLGLITGLAGFHNLAVVVAICLIANLCMTFGYIEGQRSTLR